MCVGKDRPLAPTMARTTWGLPTILRGFPRCHVARGQPPGSSSGISVMVSPCLLDPSSATITPSKACTRVRFFSTWRDGIKGSGPDHHVIQDRRPQNSLRVESTVGTNNEGWFLYRKNTRTWRFIECGSYPETDRVLSLLVGSTISDV